MEFIKEQLLLSFDQNFGHLGMTENVDLKKIFKFLRENDFLLQKLKNGKYHCKVRLSEKLLQINTILIIFSIVTQTRIFSWIHGVNVRKIWKGAWKMRNLFIKYRWYTEIKFLPMPKSFWIAGSYKRADGDVIYRIRCWICLSAKGLSCWAISLTQFETIDFKVRYWGIASVDSA